MNLHAYKQGARAYLFGLTKEENPWRKLKEQGQPTASDEIIETWDQGWELAKTRQLELK